MADSQTDTPDYTITEDELKNAEDAAKRAWGIIGTDREGGPDDIGLTKIRKYLNGEMDGPYTPSDASQEYKFLARRATSNWLIPALNAPAQALFLEDHRLAGSTESSPAFKAAFRRNRLRGRQSDLYRDALSLEEAFIATVKDEREGPLKGTAQTLLISRLNSVALYVDPVNDNRPDFFLYVQKDPVSDEKPGYGLAWDREHIYNAVITTDSDKPVKLENARLHGFPDTPVVSFTPYRDLTGKPRGVIRPLMPIQDRINQSIFDLLVTQSYGAFKVKFITGMVPPAQMTTRPVTKAEAIEAGWSPEDPRLVSAADTDVVGTIDTEVLDKDGNPVAQNIVISPSKIVIIEDPNAKVGSIPETPLDGYIASIAMSVQHLAAIAQVPPQFLLGDISNLSADALAALAASLDRMVSELKHSFDDSWCEVFRDIALCEGLGGADDYEANCMWLDLTSRSLSQTVDALGKAVQMLGIPQEALWPRFPGATAPEIDTWQAMAEEQRQENQAGPANGFRRSVQQVQGQTLQSARPTPTDPLTDE